MTEYKPGDVFTLNPPTSSFEYAKTREAELHAVVKIASDKLAAFPTGPMGLTPDHVKQTAEFQSARNEYAIAFAQLRRFNSWFVKTFKNELRAERRAKGR